MKKRISVISLIIIFCLLIGAADVFAQTAFQEVKLPSQVFSGAIVGRAVVPAGWNVRMTELTLNSESITWPNAVYVTASSPDGSIEMKYISRRAFQQQFAYANGFTGQSDDEAHDQSSMMYLLNYRNAADTCDYMVNFIFPDTNHAFVSQTPLSAKDNAAINRYWEIYDSDVRAAFSKSANTEIKGTEVSVAERIYRSGNKGTIVSAMVSGYEIVNQMDISSYTDYINWNMDCIYAMQAPLSVFDQYRDIFDVFVLNTYVSQEYNSMTELHSIELHNYFEKLKAGIPVSGEEEAKALDGISNRTVGSGDSYSAIEGWSDVIREENDFTLSSGSNIKLSTSFDHVYEGNDGTVYAGYGSYYPEGTTELFPTATGSR